MQLIFEQVRSGGDRNFGYVLGDRDAKRCVLIDPSYSPEVFVQRCKDQGLTVTHVINTHGHPDHTNGNDKARELTTAPVAAFAGSVVNPDLGLRDECGNRVHDDDVDAAGANEDLDNLERLLTVVGLRDQEIVQVDAQLLCVLRVERMFGIDEGRHAARALRFRNHLERERRLAR